MKVMDFECEILTPMFMAGADGRVPELRPPSIKGMLRFWWRALNGHLKLEKLREEEANIFGTSDEKIGRSKFSIKIYQKELKVNDFSPVPHSEKRFSSSGFIPDQTFIISLITPDNFSQIHEIFKITTILGGFGKRSRRGFGSLRIIKINGSDFDFDYSSSSICNLLNTIAPNGFKMDVDKIKKDISADPDASCPYIKEIEMGNSCKDSKGLLKVIGSSSSENNCEQTGFVDTDRKKRFSSPIYVSVIKDKNGYKPIITRLNALFEAGYPSPLKPDKSDGFISYILTQTAGGCK